MPMRVNPTHTATNNLQRFPENPSIHTIMVECQHKQSLDLTFVVLRALHEPLGHRHVFVNKVSQLRRRVEKQVSRSGFGQQSV